jgi:serine/threonine protein kinase
MYEVLTGKQLFARATRMSTWYAMSSGEVPPPSAVRPEIPPEVDRIVVKALQVSPEHRYQTAREMRGDLERLLISPPERIDDYLVKLFGKERMLERIDVRTLLRRRTPVTPWSTTPTSSSLVPAGPEPRGDSSERFRPT